ncbi:hypothetical protein BH10ACI2_BH10ACI2_00180 [soil metagenome]
MADRTLEQIRRFEAVIDAGADRESMLQRFINREHDPIVRANAQKQLDGLSARLDQIEDFVKILRGIRNARLDRERAILAKMRPARSLGNFIELKEAA